MWRSNAIIAQTAYYCVNSGVNRIIFMKVIRPLVKTIMFMSTLSCNNNNANSPDRKFPFEYEGLVEKTEFTTYMYGSHTITGNNRKYALQSKNLNLDHYNSKRVVVKGLKIEGYPVDDGPELIDVKAVDRK
jgi:hypothetical protein